MNITATGIDLAKNTFSLHGTDAQGKTVLKKTVSRGKLLEFFANLPPCTVGMEACTGAHHWARALQCLGHDASIMAPRFVIPYVNIFYYTCFNRLSELITPQHPRPPKLLDQVVAKLRVNRYS